MELTVDHPMHAMPFSITGIMTVQYPNEKRASVSWRIPVFGPKVLCKEERPMSGYLPAAASRLLRLYGRPT